MRRYIRSFHTTNRLCSLHVSCHCYIHIIVESNTSLFAQSNIIVGAKSLEDRVEEEVMEEVGTAVTAEMEADTIPVL